MLPHNYYKWPLVPFRINLTKRLNVSTLLSMTYQDKVFKDFPWLTLRIMLRFLTIYQK